MHGDKVRDWLKNLRDSGYQILGLVMSHVPSVFAMPGLAAAMNNALLGSIESMETRHLKAAIRVVLQVPLLPHSLPQLTAAMVSNGRTPKLDRLGRPNPNSRPNACVRLTRGCRGGAAGGFVRALRA